MSSSSPGFTFPAALLRPAPSQFDLAADDVRATVDELEKWFVEHGAQLGVPLHDFALKEEIDPSRIKQGVPGELVVLAVIAQAFVAKDYVSFERRDGRWGLWYRRVEPGSLAKAPVPLRDAPLAIRKAFLLRSDAFATAVLKNAETALTEPQTATAVGQATLAKLRNIRPR